MKKVLLAIITGALVMLAFNACSGDNGAFKNAKNKIEITVDCIVDPTAENIATYITVLSGDVIVTEDSNSSISTYHDINGIKKVCRVSGSAYILR